MLGAVCTAMGVEALRSTVDSFCAFLQRVRAHPGQVSAIDPFPFPQEYQ